MNDMIWHYWVFEKYRSEGAVFVLLFFIAFFVRVTIEPLWRTHDRGTEAADRSESTFLAADDAVIVEGHDLLWFAGPDRAADKMTRGPRAGRVEAETPPTITYHALAHRSIYM